ncbi:MAG: alanine:cation symporter family protein [Anaerofustis stercorihominis]|nr:alanine:cation symporter family protein [Anaerofustis stercorihominis]
MENLLAIIEKVNGAINGVVWGVPMLMLIGGTGIVITVITKFFQITKVKYWYQETIGGLFRKADIRDKSDKNAISQFQALCTALAATIGVGNIAGVATAIVSGGPGAVFWMWVSAFFGMMTNYAENVLGIFYRRKNENGEWSGGAMYYLRDGLGAKKDMRGIGKFLAVMFSVFCIGASFGIGNMSQVNNIATNMKSAFGVAPIVTGIVLMILVGLVVIGGIKRIAAVTEKFVPFMAIAYIIGAFAIVVANAKNIIPAFGAIFSFAFGFKAIGGAVAGVAVKNAITWGYKRGIFSNEAGLGSSVMVHSASNVKEPVVQGMWGIFEVFADTMLVCTLTALVILTSGVIDLNTGAMIVESTADAALVTKAFETMFGSLGAGFIALAILLFASSTVLGWSYYGTKAWEYLFGTKSTIIYKCVFVGFVVFGATMDLGLAWDISDTLNGLMALPNLIGVLALSGTVVKITQNYISRYIKGEDIDPMLSAFPEIQREQARAIKAEKTAEKLAAKKAAKEAQNQ